MQIKYLAHCLSVNIQKMKGIKYREQLPLADTSIILGSEIWKLDSKRRQKKKIKCKKQTEKYKNHHSMRPFDVWQTHWSNCSTTE